MGVSSSRSRRGQSEVLGFVLLFSLVIALSTTIVVVGNESLNDVKGDVADESAGITMADMQSMMDQSSGADPAVQRVSFAEASGGSNQQSAVSSAQLEDANAVSVVKPGDSRSGTLRVETGGTSIVDRDLGRIVHRKDDRVVAYEGGGVFRQTSGSDSSVLVSAPDFEYKYQSGRPTLSLGITRVSASSSDVITGESFTIEQIGPMPSNPIENPISSTDQVTIVVESPYYRAWAQLFRDRTRGATVTTGDDDGDGMPGAKLVLDGSSTQPPGPVDSGVFAGTGASMSNSGDVDSYRSSTGGYSGSFPVRKNGDIAIGGDFTMSNSPTIYGDVKIGGDLWSSNNLFIEGETHVGGNVATDNNPTFRGPFTVAGDLDMDADYLGNPATTRQESVVVGEELVSLSTKEVYGSMYVHGPFMVTGQSFDAGTVHGSIHAAERLDLYGIPLSGGGRTATIEGDLVSGQDVYTGTSVQFTGSQSRIDAARDAHVLGSGTKQTDVVAGRDVHVGSGVTVDGDVHAGGDVYVNGDVTGEIVAGGQIHHASDAGWTENGDPDSPRPPTLPSADPPSIPSSYSADQEIDEMRSFDDDASNNDNTTSTSDLADSGAACDPSCTLTPGDYWVDGIDLADGSEELEIQTNGEPVNIYVKPGGNVDLTDATIDVQGEGRVRIAVDGGDVTLAKNLDVRIPDDDADQLWIFTMPSAQVNTYNNPEFNGVLYGSDGAGGGTSFNLGNNPVIYGAMIGDVSSINNNPEIHYDESLQETGGSGSTGGETGNRVGYVHVTTTQVEVTDD